MKIADKVVLITGASDGIGAALAQELRARGAKLALNGRSEEKLNKAGHESDLILPADLTTDGVPRSLVEKTIERFGKLDILINNAGYGIYGPIASSDDLEVRRLFDPNFFAPLALIRAAVPRMRAQQSGMVVNVGSVAGKVALPWMPLYCTSKAALGALTETLRMELADLAGGGGPVRAMLVCPGYVSTKFQEHAPGPPPPAGVIAGRRFAISPEACARDIARGIERDARMVITPRWAWGFIALHRLLPRTVEHRLSRMQHSGGAS